MKLVFIIILALIAAAVYCGQLGMEFLHHAGYSFIVYSIYDLKESKVERESNDAD